MVIQGRSDEEEYFVHIGHKYCSDLNTSSGFTSLTFHSHHINMDFFNLNISVNNLEITERTIHKGLQYVFEQWSDVNEQDI